MSFPGFRQVARSLYYHPASSTTHQPGGPDVILLFTWLGANSRFISKYIEGYRVLYPSSAIVLTRSELSDLIESPKKAIARASETLDLVQADTREPSILVHVWSNGGAFNLQAFCHACKARRRAAFAPDAIILDSTPGSDRLRGAYTNLLSLARSVLPKTLLYRLFSYAYALLFIFGLFVLPRLRGYVALPRLIRQALNDTSLVSTRSRRCYIYSDTDTLIEASAVETHGKHAIERGYKVHLAPFQGTKHVAHMKRNPEQYWSTVSSQWNEAHTS